MLKDYLKANIPKDLHKPLNKFAAPFLQIFNNLKFVYKKLLGNKISILTNSHKKERFLEIGPGPKRIPGFETLNVIAAGDVDYVFDAAKKLPFKNNSFDLIYSSHILEHIPWFKTKNTLSEWYRILKPNGKIEIWVPDAMTILNELHRAERGENDTIPDDWKTLNPNKNRYLWVSGRLFYGVRTDYPSWHKALFTEGCLKKVLSEIGFTNITLMNKSELRTKDHGIIDLGVRGTKPITTKE